MHSLALELIQLLQPHVGFQERRHQHEVAELPVPVNGLYRATTIARSQKPSGQAPRTDREELPVRAIRCVAPGARPSGCRRGNGRTAG